jgi:SAM-dependent methyltransferase
MNDQFALPLTEGRTRARVPGMIVRIDDRGISASAMALALALCAACERAPKTAQPALANGPASSAVAGQALAASAPHAATSRPASEPVHDFAHPPIDCPLRKQGIDPTHLRPFEDVEKYIAFLERPERDLWQKPNAVVAALGLTGSETVVDLGAGSGYFTFPLARALGAGRVVAIDIEPEMIRHIHHRAMSEGAKNIEAVLGKADDPSLPAGVDLVFMCDVLHHVPARAVWLKRLASEMKSGARLAVIEFKEGKLPEGPPEAAKIPRAELVTLLTGAGFVLDADKAGLLPYQMFLVWRKP